MGLFSSKKVPKHEEVKAIYKDNGDFQLTVEGERKVMYQNSEPYTLTKENFLGGYVG